MLLTIIIPTRNRCDYLNNLLFTLSAIGVSDPIRFEVLISNNHSSDNSTEVIQKHKLLNPCVKTISPLTSLNTAEENLRFAIGHASGTYVWLLGDDDIPDPSVFPTLLSLVEGNSFDFLLFNSRGISNDGIEFTLQKVPCINTSWASSLKDFVVHDGFLYTLAGFSTVVFRRSELDLSVFDDYLNIEKIYSQVMTFIHCFSGSKFLFINLPLVKYRRNQYAEQATGHWEKYAINNQKFHMYYWTVGLILHFNHLILCNIISHKDIYYTIEQGDSSRYRLVYWIISNLCQQILLEQTRSNIYRMTATEFKMVLDFLRKTIPMEWGILDAFAKILDLMFSKQSTSNSCISTNSKQITKYISTIRFSLSNISQDPVLSQFIISKLYNRTIYGFNSQYYIVENCYTTNPELLNAIDFLDSEFVTKIEPKSIHNNITLQTPLNSLHFPIQATQTVMTHAQQPRVGIGKKSQLPWLRYRFYRFSRDFQKFLRKVKRFFPT